MSSLRWQTGAIGRFLDSGRPDDPLATRTWSRTESAVVVAVFVIAAAWAAHQLPIGWDHTISGPYQHGFRQAQTALTVVRMLEGGPLVSYETPVLGPPWSVPFEFPLYQWTVAALSAGLDAAPRARRFADALARQLGLDPTPRPVEWCVLYVPPGAAAKTVGGGGSSPYTF